jgi:cell division protein FtsA
MGNTDKIIVGLDIGTTKICAIVGQLSENGKINVLGMGKAPSAGGVSRGMVANITKAETAIRKAIDEARRQSQVDIKNVFVGIAGHHIKSLQHRGTLSRQNSEEEISSIELSKLEDEMRNIAMPPGQEIIHIVPQEYRIDDEEGVKEPEGRLGVRVECNYHIVTGQSLAARHIYKAVRRAELEVVDLVVEPFASAAAVLSAEEMEAGVALVDIGGGTTDLCIFEGGIVRHTAIVDIGGDRVTKDMQEAFGILGEQAEYVKINHGSCYPIESQKNEVVVVPGLPNRTPKEISLFGISQVIQARMEDIIERIQYELNLSGYDGKLPGGLIITGGGSSLKNITQLFSFRLGMDVNLGVPNQHLGKGLTDEVKSPIFATGIGLVLKGFEITESTEEQMNHKIRKETEAAASQAAEEMDEAVLEEVEANKAGFSTGIKNLFSGSWGLSKGIRDWMEDGEDDFEND